MLINPYRFGGGGSGGCAPVEGLTVFTTPTGTSNVTYAPAYGLYEYSVTVSLILASEIGAGVSKQFTGLAFELNGWTNGYTMENQNIEIFHTSESSIQNNGTVNNPVNDIRDKTVVKSNFTFVAQNGTVYVQVNFDTNFCWNGTDNVVVRWTNNSGAYTYSGYGWSEGISGSGVGNRFGYDYQDGSPVPETEILLRQTRRPNIRFNY
jgi:hypothetical protein